MAKRVQKALQIGSPNELVLLRLEEMICGPDGKSNTVATRCPAKIVISKFMERVK
jgi:hypothetical protein